MAAAPPPARPGLLRRLRDWRIPIGKRALPGVLALLIGLLLCCCGSFFGLALVSSRDATPSATQPSAAPGRPQTVRVPQTVIVRETVLVPQTVIVRQTVAPPAPPATSGPTRTLAPTVAPTGTAAPLALSGKGQQATAQFNLPAGLVVFEMQHDGKANFIVRLLDEQGRPVGLTLVNEIGAFNGSKAVQVPKAGAYLLDIAADGNWTIKTR